MEIDKNKENERQDEQGNTPDPQEDEKNGNILGPLFDKVFGNFEGDKGLGQDEFEDPDKQGSIKD